MVYRGYPGGSGNLVFFLLGSGTPKIATMVAQVSKIHPNWSPKGARRGQKWGLGSNLPPKSEISNPYTIYNTSGMSGLSKASHFWSLGPHNGTKNHHKYRSSQIPPNSHPHITFWSKHGAKRSTPKVPPDTPKSIFLGSPPFWVGHGRLSLQNVTPIDLKSGAPGLRKRTKS